jgi:regulator of sigma E protease
MTTIVAFLFVIGVIVFVHELGHFLMARYHGVRVEVFSLGFGPKLVTLHHRGTDYCVSAIPLGGYVKMAGERVGTVGAADEFLSKTKWQRCQILAAGPAMNLILAAVIVAAAAVIGMDAPLYDRAPAVVGAVVHDSPAAQAGLSRGDEILRVSGQSTPTWDSVEGAIGMRPHRRVPLVVRRRDRTLELTVVPTSDTASGVGTIGVVRHIAPVVASITPGSPADRAGLREGDIITAIDGAPALPSQDGPEARRGSKSAPLEITVWRQSADDHLVTIVPSNTSGEMGYSTIVPTTVRRAGVFQAIRLGVEWTARTGSGVMQVLQRLVTRDVSVTQLMGPLGIAQLAGHAADISWSALFSIVALVSVNVGIFNLLPVPVLDGGHMLMLGLEAIMRRDFTAPARRLATRTGLTMLLLLMAVAFYNDLGRLAWGL